MRFWRHQLLRPFASELGFSSLPRKFDQLLLVLTTLLRRDASSSSLYLSAISRTLPLDGLWLREASLRRAGAVRLQVCLDGWQGRAPAVSQLHARPLASSVQVRPLGLSLVN